MNALFIGRFQPFHNGHLNVIKNASKEYNKIIIGIGSSQYKNTFENPFTAEERRLMIEKSLENIDIKNFQIILIPDIHNPPKWVNHVLSIFSNFDVILSNNSLTKKLFSEKGYKIKETKIYKKNKYSGKKIRMKIIKDQEWKNLVPIEVYNIIKQIDGIKRLKSISKRKI